MNILVTTPGGTVGRAVLSELLAPEFSVRVILRHPERLNCEIRDQVEVVQGSADDAGTLRRALEGVDALFWCVPRGSCPESGSRTHYERFARAAREALAGAQTPRVVTISSCGKGLARNAGPISGLHDMEDILNECGASIRHLRCAPFMDEFLGQAPSIWQRGSFAYPMPEHVAIPMVAAGDVADVALRWLVRRDWAGIESVPLHGPRDLSFGQAAAVISRALKRPVRYREASANHYVQALLDLGASAESARGFVDMFAELAQGISRAEPRTAASTTPTFLETWAERELLPVVASFDGDSRTEETRAVPCRA